MVLQKKKSLAFFDSDAVFFDQESSSIRRGCALGRTKIKNQKIVDTNKWLGSIEHTINTLQQNADTSEF